MKFIPVLAFILISIYTSAKEIPTIAEVFDYEIGDVFHYRSESAWGMFVYTEEYTVLDKFYSTAKDTLFYKMQRNYNNGEVDETILQSYVNLDSSIFTYIKYEDIVIGDTIAENYSGLCDLQLIGFISYVWNSYKYLFGKGIGIVSEIVWYEEDPTATGPYLNSKLVYFKKGEYECGTPLSGINLQASYIRMVDTTNVWDVLCGGITTNGDDLRQTDKLHFLGDTIVNDTIYRKLYSQVYYTPNDSALNYIAALREDSVQQKIYRRNGLGAASTEKLLYDFLLQSGDSVVFYIGSYNEPSPIKIDSIVNELFAGQIRRIFYITSYSKMPGNYWSPYNYQWIEGIGKVDDFGKIVGPVDDFEWMIDELLCFWKSGQMLYQNPIYSACKIVHVGIEKADLNEFLKTYPNPVQDYLIVETSGSIKESILIIYNITGQELIRQSIKDIETHIDITNFARGIYFVKLDTDKGVIVKKILKE